jgi:hypothetical protein
LDVYFNHLWQYWPESTFLYVGWIISKTPARLGASLDTKMLASRISRQRAAAACLLQTLLGNRRLPKTDAAPI